MEMRLERAVDKKITSTFAMVLMLTSLTALVQAQQPYSPSNLILTVYADGVIQVEYDLNVDVTFPRMNITLFGHIFENLIVVDEGGTPLDYELIDGGVTVDTLGAAAVKITYNTPDLTNKSGRIWTLNLNSPISTSIIMPSEATVISLNQVPIAVRNIDGQLLLEMPEGEQEVTYVIGVVGTREHALVLINEAQNTITQIKSTNINVTGAEAKLQEAKAALDREEYPKAEELATQAKNLALQTNSTATQALNIIDRAEVAIDKAQLEGRTEGLTEARQLLQKAENEYANGNYQQAQLLAEKAEETAQSAVSPTTPSPTPIPTPTSPPTLTPTPPPSPTPTPAPSPLMEPLHVGVVSAVVVGIVVSVVYLLLRKRKPPPSAVPREKRVINVNAIFEENPQLRHDDREVIQYIAECGGEALEAEIRERFKLPRTTVWRMIKRLEREDVADIRKVGGQNLVHLKSKYQQ